MSANFDAFCAKDELKEVLPRFYVDFLITVRPLRCRVKQRSANPTVSSRICWFWLELALFFFGIVCGHNAVSIYDRYLGVTGQWRLSNNWHVVLCFRSRSEVEW